MSFLHKVRDSWTRAQRFVRDEIWSREPPGPQSAAGALRFAVMVGEGFVRDRLLLRASALSYFTVLSLIPLVAVVISIVGSIGIRENLAEQMAEWMVGQVAAGAPEAREQILRLITEARFGALGTLGAVALFLTTVLGISNVERALNSIWGVTQHRTWARRFPDYLAVLIIGPLLLGSAVSLEATLRSQWLVQRLFELPVFSVAYDLGLRHAPTLVLCGALTFLYWFLPNTRVRFGAALLGGAIAGVLVVLAQRLYLDSSMGVARYNAFFGTFAALPLLFVWIYFLWAIVLFGAEVAFAYQNLPLYSREVRGGKPDPAAREAIGLRVAVEVARAFEDGRPATSDGLADALDVPVRTVRDVLQPLREGGILVRRGEVEAGDAYQLGRPAARVAVIDVLAALRGERQPVSGGDARVAELVERVFSEVEEGAEKGASGQTLADLVQALRAPARAETSLDPASGGR